MIAISHRQPITALIQENFSIIMTFVFSRSTISKWLDEKFKGEWKYLWMACYELPETRANRALLELGTQLRLLDNEEQLSQYLKNTDSPPFGKVFKEANIEEDLFFRDLTNKIVHCSRIQWETSLPEDAKIICHGDDKGRWLRAEISVPRLAAFCGQLMF
jgi:hypothetical protein